MMSKKKEDPVDMDKMGISFISDAARVLVMNRYPIRQRCLCVAIDQSFHVNLEIVLTLTP